MQLCIKNIQNWVSENIFDFKEGMHIYFHQQDSFSRTKYPGKDLH